jgi:hypothetical protein
MGNCVFGYENRIGTGTLSASAEALPVANLQLDQADGGASWQAGATTAWLRIDAGSAVNWRLFGLFRTNLTQAATVTVRLGTTAGASDVALLAAGAGVIAGIGQWVGALASPATARHCEIAISDTGNPDGFVRVGLVFAGPVWQPTRNFSYRSPAGRDLQILNPQARGGQEFPRVDWRRRTRAVSLPFVTAAEAADPLLRLTAWADQARNVLFVPDPDASTRHADAIFGRALVGAVDFPGPAPSWRTVDITMTERL